MTVREDQEPHQMDRVIVRVPQLMDEWVGALVAEGHFNSKSAAWREGARRIVTNPTRMWSVARVWQDDFVDRHNFRVPTKLLAQVNELDRDGWAAGTSEIFRVGIAVVADEHLASVDLDPRKQSPPTSSKPAWKRKLGDG